MNDPRFFGVESKDSATFLDLMELMRETGDLRCLAELRVRQGEGEIVWAYGVNGVLEWSRTSAYTTPDIVSKAVVRGDGWHWEIENIEWIGSVAGSFQFSGYAQLPEFSGLQRVRLLWQMIW